MQILTIGVGLMITINCNLCMSFKISALCRELILNFDFYIKLGIKPSAFNLRTRQRLERLPSCSTEFGVAECLFQRTLRLFAL